MYSYVYVRVCLSVLVFLEKVMDTPIQLYKL